MQISHGKRPVSRSRNESGETLVEIILTVILISTTIVALVTALFTVVASSSASKRRAQTANEATTVVETIDRAVYVNCAGTGTYNAALSTVPTVGFTPTITAVRYIADPGASTPTWQAGCPGGGDRGLQQITVRIESTQSAKVTTSVTVVKRRAVCPASIVTVPGESC